MLSSTSDYALRALLVLARRRGLGPVRADEVADATGAPRNYMAKTLNALAKAGIVSSLRGPAGGFTLVAEPAALPIARVVDLFETPRAHPRCLLGAGPCDPTRPCAAHQRWTRVAEARRAPLAMTTIADLLGDAA
ncbi:MAG: RrF2 family transcriptional regulator [Gemmatimonadaceae bacterium]